MDVEALVSSIDAGLRAAGSPERAVHERAYLKSDLQHYGASVPAIRAVVREASRRHSPLERRDLLAAVERLWGQRVHEARMAAVELLDLHADLLVPADLALLERLVREARTWALVDGLAASVVGALVVRQPEVAEAVDGWAEDEDMWLRRAALLSQLVPLRRGDGDFDRFSRYADAMLDEEGFFIRKAIGWVLRDTARKRPDLVFEWLLPRAARASGVTVREAVKPLSEEQRKRILAAR